MTDEDAMRPKPGANRAGNGVDGQSTDPADPPRDATAAEQERIQLRAELDELKDRWMRERADLENFKRRAAREKQDALRFGSENLLKDLLPVIDNLHRALAHAKSDDPIVAGVELVLRGIDEVFERHGVKIVPARGTPFDPNRHEAISHVESDAPANTVIDEHQRGYVLHDRLLRPALVTVGKGPARAHDIAKDSDDA
jgi:molecular chaperone GrpE